MRGPTKPTTTTAKGPVPKTGGTATTGKPHDSKHLPR